MTDTAATSTEQKASEHHTEVDVVLRLRVKLHATEDPTKPKAKRWLVDFKQAGGPAQDASGSGKDYTGAAYDAVQSVVDDVAKVVNGGNAALQVMGCAVCKVVYTDLRPNEVGNVYCDGCQP